MGIQTEFRFDAGTKMEAGFPQFRRLGAVSPNGESSPFLFGGRMMRLELADPTHGTDPSAPTQAIIRDRETGEIVSAFGECCYYYSLYQESGTVYVLGTRSIAPGLSGDTILLFESTDLRQWKCRELFSRPGWRYFNSSLTKGPDGYVLLLEANMPRESVGPHPFTLFFLRSADMVHWEPLDDCPGFSQERYMGGPWLRWSRGWYYVISVTELPCTRYSNYLYRTKDFLHWEDGFYNPLLSPCEEDRRLSPYAYDITPEMMREIRTGFLSSSSDMDLCDWPEKGATLITYNLGNQLGFYYMAEAMVDKPLDDFLEDNFR